ncbi:alpha/beta hydrolase [Nitrospinota bacterium]
MTVAYMDSGYLRNHDRTRLKHLGTFFRISFILLVGNFAISCNNKPDTRFLLGCERISKAPLVSIRFIVGKPFLVSSRRCQTGKYEIAFKPRTTEERRLTLPDAVRDLPANAKITVLIQGYRTSESGSLSSYSVVLNKARASSYPDILIAYDWPSIARLSGELRDEESTVWQGIENVFNLQNGISAQLRDAIRGYLSDQIMAEKYGMVSFLQFLSDLRAFTPVTKINIICFSMGCFLLQKALETGDAQSISNLNRLVFLAADIDRTAFQRVLIRLRDYQRVGVFFSRNDRVVTFASRLANLGARLGAKGPIETSDQRLRVFDFTEILGKGDVHSKYLDENYPVIQETLNFLD